MAKKMAQNASHVTREEGGRGRSVDIFAATRGKIGLNSGGNQKLLCCMLGKQKKGLKVETLQKMQKVYDILQIAVVQQSALVSALLTGFLASARPFSTSPAFARRTFDAVLQRRSSGRRTHRKS